ncbi:MAG: hypothetical protein M0Z67_04255 [Nitrospiraceae bacterium]|nr:hypothetical protein [Nitrospiraceae bacterium]
MITKLYARLVSRFEAWRWTPQGKYYTLGAAYRDRLKKGSYKCPECGQVHEFTAETPLCPVEFCHAPICPETGQCSAGEKCGTWERPGLSYDDVLRREAYETIVSSGGKR